MRILVLIIQFPPDMNPSGLLMAQLGEGLVARGHQVSVVTTFPHYEKFRISDEFRGKLFERGSYRGMDVLRLYVYASGDKRKMSRRLLSYLSFNALASIAGVVSRQRYDVILCSNGSFFSGISSALIGLVKGTPLSITSRICIPKRQFRLASYATDSQYVCSNGSSGSCIPKPRTLVW